MKQKSTSFKKMYQSKPADGRDSTSNDDGAEDRLAKHRFFLNDDLQGTDEGEQLAKILADLLSSAKVISPNGG